MEAARTAAIEIAASVNVKSGIMVSPLKVAIDSLNILSMFLRKKGYAIVSISSIPGDAVKPKLKIKGLQFVKRDSCVFLRETGDGFLKRLMVERKSKSECFQYLHQQLSDLMSGRVDADKLVLAKKLSKELDGYGADATELHVAAARQLEVAGEHVSPGDRIRYFVCEPPQSASSRNILKKDQVVAEPLWRANPAARKIDYAYYAKGLVKSFEVIGPVVFGESNAKRLFDLNAYTAQTARFRQMLTGGSAAGSQSQMALVYEEEEGVCGADLGGGARKRARVEEMKEQVQRSARFMDAFVSRGPKAVRGKPAGVSLDI